MTDCKNVPAGHCDRIHPTGRWQKPKNPIKPSRSSSPTIQLILSLICFIRGCVASCVCVYTHASCTVLKCSTPESLRPDDERNVGRYINWVRKDDRRLTRSHSLRASHRKMCVYTCDGPNYCGREEEIPYASHLQRKFLLVLNFCRLAFPTERLQQSLRVFNINQMSHFHLDVDYEV